MLRGRLIKLGDRLAEQVKAPPEVQWVLNGDRGLTYSQGVPEGSTVVAGQWWPADYAGEPLVSFEADIAKGLGLEDRRHRHRQRARPQRHRAHRQSARGEMGEPVAQLRPGVLAQYAGRRSAQSAGDRDAAEGRVAGRRGQARAADRPRLPGVRPPSASRTPSMPSTPFSVASWLPCGRPAASRLLAGALCWPARLATAQRRRIQQAVILKTLGATSRRILLSHLAEYAVLAVVNGVHFPSDRQPGGLDYRVPRDGRRFYLFHQGGSRGYACRHRAGGRCSAALAPGACSRPARCLICGRNNCVHRCDKRPCAGPMHPKFRPGMAGAAVLATAGSHRHNPHARSDCFAPKLKGWTKWLRSTTGMRRRHRRAHRCRRRRGSARIHAARLQLHGGRHRPDRPRRLRHLHLLGHHRSGARRLSGGRIMALHRGMYLTPFGQTIFATPLKWVLMLRPARRSCSSCPGASTR